MKSPETKRDQTESIHYVTSSELLPRGADQWDIIQELYYEGRHLEAGTWHSQKWVYQNLDPGMTVQHREEQLKKDDDAKWEVVQTGPAKVEYTLSAKSCMFSCDEVKIRVYVRFVKAN